MVCRRLFSYGCCALLLATSSFFAMRVYAGSLSNVSVVLNNSYIDHTVTGYTLHLTTAAQLNSIQRIEVQFSTSVGGVSKPSGLDLSNGQFIQVTGGSGGSWNIDTSEANAGRIAIVSSSPLVATANTNLSIYLANITNSTHNACNGVNSTTLLDTCFARITTYSGQDRSNALDVGDAPYTMQEDPLTTFSVNAVSANQVVDGLQTNSASSRTNISFGSVLPGQVHYVAQQLTLTTNAPNGYTVYAVVATPLSGSSPLHPPVSPFGATNATWSSPQPWMTPTGMLHNNNTAWLAGHTTDVRVSGWGANVTGKLGPISTTRYPVATNTHSDRSGSSITVVYAFGANSLQSSDSYTGSISYQVVAIF